MVDKIATVTPSRTLRSYSLACFRRSINHNRTFIREDDCQAVLRQLFLQQLRRASRLRTVIKLYLRRFSLSSRVPYFSLSATINNERWQKRTSIYFTEIDSFYVKYHTFTMRYYIKFWCTYLIRKFPYIFIEIKKWKVLYYKRFLWKF